MRNCGSSLSGREPTTRFIQAMLRSVRATTLRRSSARWDLGSGSPWHWPQACSGRRAVQKNNGRQENRAQQVFEG